MENKIVLNGDTRTLNRFLKGELSNIQAKAKLLNSIQGLELSKEYFQEEIEALFLGTFNALNLEEVLECEADDETKLIVMASIASYKIDIKYHRLPDYSLVQMGIEIPRLSKEEYVAYVELQVNTMLKG